MRILAITHQYPTKAQPTFASYNRQQFAQLSRHHELRVIRPVPWPLALRNRLRGGRRPEKEAGRDGIAVYTPTFYYPPGLWRHRYGSYFEWSVSATVRRVLTTFKPDVLLSSWAHPDGWAAARLGRAAGLPVVVKVLGSDVLVLAKGKRRSLIAEALRAADSVIAVSQDLATHVAQLGVPARLIRVVPEGIDSGQFAPGDRLPARERLGLPVQGKLVLFVGNLIVSKGAGDLVRACALLRDRGISFECRLVGQGSDATMIRRLIGVRGLDDRVTLVGVRPHAELVDWYRASDVVALPSHSEGIPNVLREAMACGRPFVATPVGGIPEIADPSFSRLAPAGDVVELANALATMLASPPRVDMDIVRRINISWEESARQVALELERAVASRNPRAIPS